MFFCFGPPKGGSCPEAIYCAVSSGTILYSWQIFVKRTHATFWRTFYVPFITSALGALADSYSIRTGIYSCPGALWMFADIAPAQIIIQYTAALHRRISFGPRNGRHTICAFSKLSFVLCGAQGTANIAQMACR